MLEERGEQPATIAQVLAARTLIAKWRGERAAYAEARGIALAPSSAIPVRAGDAAIARYRRAMGRGLALTILAVACLAIHVAATIPMAIGLVAMINARASMRRLERQRVAGKFLRPATT